MAITAQLSVQIFSKRNSAQCPFFDLLTSVLPLIRITAVTRHILFVFLVRCFFMGIQHQLQKVYVSLNNIKQNRMKNTKELMHCHCDTNNKAPRKYRGMVETQMSGDKTSSGGIGLNIRTHTSPKVGQDQVSGGVSVPFRHATPVAHASWKPIFSNVTFN